MSAIVTLGSLALNSAPWRVLQKGTNVPPPPLKRQTAGSLYRDGEEITAASYANRVITLRVMLMVSDPATADTQLALLDAELDEDRNELLWQPHPGFPAVQFNTWRSPDYEIELQEFALGIHILMLNLIADPLGVAP